MMVTKEWLDDYFGRHVERKLKEWGPTADPMLADRMRTYLFLGLKRLNALPPEDPFWINTNREPTLYKLVEYFSKDIATDRHNEEKVWIIASCLLLNCADRDLGWLLEPLLERNFSSIEWVVAAGAWISKISGFSHTSSLRDLLVRLRNQLPELQDRLDSLRQNATAHRLLMIDEALNLNSKAWADALSPPAES
jgi:hypothetical protein